MNDVPWCSFVKINKTRFYKEKISFISVENTSKKKQLFEEQDRKLRKEKKEWEEKERDYLGKLKSKKNYMQI